MRAEPVTKPAQRKSPGRRVGAYPDGQAVGWGIGLSPSMDSTSAAASGSLHQAGGCGPRCRGRCLSPG
jgi:hypothetical protein